MEWLKGAANNRFLRSLYLFFRSFFFDPRVVINNWRAIPYFLRNYSRYKSLNRMRTFDIRLTDVYFTSGDRFADAGSARGHYFWQDLWAARRIFSEGIKEHVDVGSLLSGFVSHILPFCRVIYVDIRPLPASIEGLEFRQGSILALPFADNSVLSLSALHVLEHIGLGRYGDDIDPAGYLKAAGELSRVLAPGGRLLLGTPVGRERLCFDAHRIFDPQTVIDAFHELQPTGFSLIDDKGESILENATFEEARKCDYGCGLFQFNKRRV